VPKSGQRWDAGFLERSALLREHRELARPLLAGPSWPTLDEYGALAEGERRRRAAELSSVRFAEPVRRSRSGPIELAQLYDGRIALRGEVPCVGASYHDFLNVIAWAAFPRAKRALHARQYRALTRWLPAHASRLPNRRTREQDALALLDEGGAALVVPEELAARLRKPGADPYLLSDEPRARVVLFGHALMEHVCFESSAVRAAALLVCREGPPPDGAALFDLVDRALAERLANPVELAEPSSYHVLTIQPPALAWV